MVHELTKAQMEAFKWLQNRNGDGVFERNHQVLLASGERAPHTRATWNALAKAGLVEFYMNNKRLRLTQGGPITHLNETALEAAAKKLLKLRLEDVQGRKDRPAETVKSALNRGFNGVGSVEGLAYILKFGVEYYLSAHSEHKSGQGSFNKIAAETDLCDDCPPVGYPTDKTRCTPCPRRPSLQQEGK